MQENKRFDLVLFDTPNHAMMFEKKAKEAGLTGRLIPVPRALSLSCGFCFRSLIENREELKNLAESKKLCLQRIVEDYEL